MLGGNFVSSNFSLASTFFRDHSFFMGWGGVLVRFEKCSPWPFHIILNVWDNSPAPKMIEKNGIDRVYNSAKNSVRMPKMAFLRFWKYKVSWETMSLDPPALLCTEQHHINPTNYLVAIRGNPHNNYISLIEQLLLLLLSCKTAILSDIKLILICLINGDYFEQPPPLQTTFLHSIPFLWSHNYFLAWPPNPIRPPYVIKNE